ncbi:MULTISPECIES: LacI family DNA-binding transcriptional regulator [unclassified Streptomyces]|uniref:LacI family DNA-binding transcriptional regulator n=1 Tax=unclassified Streptomyces TaxID=2593676 RepID=UPI00190DAE3B|nr:MULTISPECIES: LacI family DNA-binding transcriptional regulator [unclassified Streptomyces]MBK3565662.1 LacI family DNA-binding transcriptional regulator [Streptomyces sp. MBT62]MBK6017369.1 LacI family DNA-binding transcriptional regulator [Streptomyces sp. MBT53]
MTVVPSLRPAGRAKLTDVARLAGVSVGTASKALNGGGRMRPETRQRVLDAVEALDFRPNPQAQSLHTGRSWTVGLMTTDGIGRFSTPVLLGAEDALGAGKISVLLCDTRGDAIREQHHLSNLMDRRVDGIIVTGRRTDPRPPLKGVEPIPTVYALSPSTDPDDISVVSDDRSGAQLAIEHLLAAGRTQIAHITGPAHHAAASDRARHTLELLQGSSLELATGRVHFGEWSEAWGRRAADAVLRTAPDTDAFFCGNDQIARGVTDALRERGVSVPADIAVVGYDNWDVMALASRPPLTTIDTDLSEIGRRAALLLLDAIGSKPEPGLHTVPCRLIVREST